MRYYKFGIVSLIAILSLTGCNENMPNRSRLQEAAANEDVSYKENSEDSAQVDASNVFGLKVLQKIMSNNPKKSFIISPSGLRYSLSMLANGADGSTLTNLQKAIGAVNIDMKNVNALNRRMIIGQQKPTGGRDVGYSTMTNNNRFEDKGININRSYKACLESNYFATVSNIDSNESTATLTNKVTFKAPWVSNFYNLRKVPFQTVSGDSIYVTMMENTDEELELSGMKDSLYSAVLLPYAGQFSMLVVLPANNYSISSLLNLLTTQRLKNIRHSLRQYDEMHVHLPSFTTKANNNMKEVLTDLGYGDMFFKEKANLSRMVDSRKPLYVEKMTQEAEIIVDQYGTSAKAMTNVGIATLSEIRSRHPTKMYFYADHPFFYAIYDAFDNICFCGIFTGQ
jgi:serine protease inhibitor